MKLEKIFYCKKDQIAWVVLSDPVMRNPITGAIADKCKYGVTKQNKDQL